MATNMTTERTYIPSPERELWAARDVVAAALRELDRIALAAIRTDTPEGMEAHDRIWSLIKPTQAALNDWYDRHINAPAAAANAANAAED